MQPKVSMVIPCYNKIYRIKCTFESILAQKWDNIELILVNDGSTDGTRKVIGRYIPIFQKRGFEVTVIDQENKGVAAAVYTGLKRVTGEFVCQVDADDELDPEYVSIMSGWLAENLDYDWVSCDVEYVSKNHSFFRSPFPLGADTDCRVDKYIFRKILGSVWIYMFRASYMLKCGMLSDFYQGRDGAQEAQIFIPLAAGGGKIKHFELPLYKVAYLSQGTHHSYYNPADIDSIRTFHQGWFNSVKKTVNVLSISISDKEKYCVYADFSFLRRVLDDLSGNGIFDEQFMLHLREYVRMANIYFTPYNITFGDDISHYKVFVEAVESCILGTFPKSLKPISKRIIAWGVLGKYGKLFLPNLKGTILEPTELWDIAGDGVTVKQPDIESLNSDDTVLFIPRQKMNGEDLEKVNDSGCSLIMYHEIIRIVALDIYPQFFNGSVRFSILS